VVKKKENIEITDCCPKLWRDRAKRKSRRKDKERGRET
jgi:hypothetical protein